MTITAVDTADDHLLAHWSDGTASRFHYIWLRDNCGCPTCRHATVGERLLDTVTIPLDIAPTAVGLDPSSGAVDVSWSGDAHVSRFDASWLRSHAYDELRDAAGSTAAVADTRRLWRSELTANLPQIDYAAACDGGGGTIRWLDQLAALGVSFVRGAPTTEGAVIGLAEHVGPIRNSNFGLLWDVISKPDPNSLAYTAHRLSAHTDLVARTVMPGLQFLHCLVFEADGGDSLLVDGFACADELRRSDPESFELLSTMAVLYRYRDRETDIQMRAPMIGVDRDGRVAEVRYSNALLAPIDVAADFVVPYYRAMARFVGLLRAPEFEVRVRLHSGDVMCFDNFRVLHGRAEFDPNSGPRHLQGCYVDRDDFLSRRRVLARDAAP